MLRYLLASIVGALIGSTIFNALIAILSIADMWSRLPQTILQSLPFVLAAAIVIGALTWLLVPLTKSRTISVIAAISIFVGFLGGFTFADRIATQDIPVQELGGAFSDYTIYFQEPGYYAYQFVGRLVSAIVTALLLLMITRFVQGIRKHA